MPRKCPQISTNPLELVKGKVRIAQVKTSNTPRAECDLGFNVVTADWIEMLIVKCFTSKTHESELATSRPQLSDDKISKLCDALSIPSHNSQLLLSRNAQFHSLGILEWCPGGTEFALSGQ